MESHSALRKPRPASPRALDSRADEWRSPLHGWVAQGILHPDDWDGMARADRDHLAAITDLEELLGRLVSLDLLTPYVAQRVRAVGTSTGP